jgi:hypothetical protein
MKPRARRKTAFSLALLVMVACKGRATATGAGAVMGDNGSTDNGASDPIYAPFSAVSDLDAVGQPTDALDAATVPSSLGLRRDVLEGRCRTSGGRWESAAGDSGWCRGADSVRIHQADERFWFSDRVVTARTSFGPEEAFDAANARADRIGASPWGAEEVQSWAL